LTILKDLWIELEALIEALQDERVLHVTTPLSMLSQREISSIQSSITRFYPPRQSLWKLGLKISCRC
jgi:hypothetical protein